MSEDILDIPLIINRVKTILNKNHNIEAKKNIKYFPNESRPNRINFACPICNDSDSDCNAKRGNIWFNTMKFVCFNCDTKLSYLKFCERMNEDVPIDEKLQIYNHIDTNVTYSNSADDYTLKSLDKLLDLDVWIDHMNNSYLSWLTNVKPVQKNSAVYQYLKFDRLIDNHENFLEGTYRVIKNDKVAFKTPVVIILNRHKNKLVGIQLRNLEKDKEKRFYKIVNFQELYNDINTDNLLDEIEAIPYNKLSHFYNILNVDFNKPITVFEGTFDAYFFPNSIGLVGANNDNDILNFILNTDENIELRFFYDNDSKGMEKANKMIGKKSVFLWNKLITRLLKGKNYYDAYPIYKKIIDLNQLVITSKNIDVYTKLKFEDYFSIDEFDAMYLDIPKPTEKKTYNKTR